MARWSEASCGEERLRAGRLLNQRPGPLGVRAGQGRSAGGRVQRGGVSLGQGRSPQPGDQRPTGGHIQLGGEWAVWAAAQPGDQRPRPGKAGRVQRGAVSADRAAPLTQPGGEQRRACGLPGRATVTVPRHQRPRTGRAERRPCPTTAPRTR